MHKPSNQKSSSKLCNVHITASLVKAWNCPYFSLSPKLDRCGIIGKHNRTEIKLLFLLAANIFKMALSKNQASWWKWLGQEKKLNNFSPTDRSSTNDDWMIHFLIALRHSRLAENAHSLECMAQKFWSKEHRAIHTLLVIMAGKWAQLSGTRLIYQISIN